MTQKTLAPVMFVSHGGGPLPLLGDPGHSELTATLKTMAAAVDKPDAIVMISAHWEEDGFQVTSAAQPPLIYDYGGFPPAAYKYTYAAPGNPQLAAELQTHLLANNLQAALAPNRGFDHGVFVPLKIMYPQGDIPVVCISLNKNFSPQQHIQLGQALAPLRRKNVLILGSGMSFHNLPMLFDAQAANTRQASTAFNAWLDDTLGEEVDSEQVDSEAGRANALINWQNAPHARSCHPREEHLLPLHVCYGAAQSRVKIRYQFSIMGVDSRCYLWQ